MEKFETSLSGIEHKLVDKMFASENSVNAALSNIEGRLESLEGQSLTYFLRVRNFCKTGPRFWPECFGFSRFHLSCESRLISAFD